MAASSTAGRAGRREALGLDAVGRGGLGPAAGERAEALDRDRFVDRVAGPADVHDPRVHHDVVQLLRRLVRPAVDRRRDELVQQDVVAGLVPRPCVAQHADMGHNLAGGGSSRCVRDWSRGAPAPGGALSIAWTDPAIPSAPASAT